MVRNEILCFFSLTLYGCIFVSYITPEVKIMY